MEKTTGLIHIYCGNGKGKTTTGMGLCLRAAGYGYKVLIYQFMKNNSTSERKSLAKIDNITVLNGQDKEKFSFQMTEEEKEQHRRFFAQQLAKIDSLVRENDIDVLFMDEVVYTIKAGLLDEKLVMERADYVSEICMRKHPFQKGIPARLGIER